MDLFDSERLGRTLRQEQERGTTPGAALAALRVAADRELARALAAQVGLAFETLESPEPQALARVPSWLARRAMLFPVALRNGQLVLAVEDPTARPGVEQASAIAGMPVDLVVAARADIEAALERWRDMLSREPEPLALQEGAATEEPGSPVIALLNDALEEAAATGAEEVHVETDRDGGRIRFRRGGRFVTRTELPRAVMPALVGRIKGVASMDQAEQRLPQTANLRLRLKGRVLPLTASTLPTLHGEKVVIGVGEEEGPAPSLAGLGLSVEAEARVREVLRGAGWLLVAGAGRSGRRTFAQSAAQAVADDGRSAVSIEHERTRELTGVAQVLTRPHLGLTISVAFRSARSQHADAIACQVQDYETSEMCARAALEGAVVIGWVPSASAMGGLCRLMDMGLEPFMVLETVKLAQGQRAVRTLCADCRVAVPADRLVPAVAAALEKAAGALPAETFAPGGCARCHGDGYRGRTGVFEHVVLSGELAEMYAKGASRRELRQRATADGWTTLRTEALKLSAAGRISVVDALSIGDND